jgi:hypothetical protein
MKTQYFTQRAESPESNSVGRCPTSKEGHRENQALKGRKQDRITPFQGLGSNVEPLFRRALPYAIANKAFSLWVKYLQPLSTISVTFGNNIFRFNILDYNRK